HFICPGCFIFDITNRTGIGGVKIAEAFPEGRGSPHGCGLRARLTGRYLAPDPVAEGDKLKVPRSGDFVRQSPGVQGAAATGCPLRAPSASGFIWHCT
ncbi:TPA: hypothetical protein OQW88_004406, partial [Shigella flexneri]|nr:hypothetical protein [Shigella flexneri]